MWRLPPGKAAYAGAAIEIATTAAAAAASRRASFVCTVIPAPVVGSIRGWNTPQGPKERRISVPLAAALGAA